MREGPRERKRGQSQARYHPHALRKSQDLSLAGPAGRPLRLLLLVADRSPGWGTARTTYRTRSPYTNLDGGWLGWRGVVVVGGWVGARGDMCTQGATKLVGEAEASLASPSRWKGVLEPLLAEGTGGNERVRVRATPSPPCGRAVAAPVRSVGE